MEWSGINRKVTDIGAPGGMAYYMANARLLQAGEAQRRYGFCKSSVDKAAAGIVGMAVTYTPNGPIYMNVTSDGAVSGQGFGGGGGGLPGPLWGGPRHRPPVGAAANCNAWDDFSDSLAVSLSFPNSQSLGTFSDLPNTPCPKTLTITATPDVGHEGEAYTLDVAILENTIWAVSDTAYYGGGGTHSLSVTLPDWTIVTTGAGYSSFGMITPDAGWDGTIAVTLQ
jgi:hypothetical protein